MTKFNWVDTGQECLRYSKVRARYLYRDNKIGATKKIVVYRNGQMQTIYRLDGSKEWLPSEQALIALIGKSK